MKKFLAMMLAAVMLLAMLAACGNNTGNGGNTGNTGNAGNAGGDANPGDTAVDYTAMTIEELKPLIETVDDGKLTVATSPDFAPYEFYAIGEDGTPELAGFEMALAQYIADYIGLELETVEIDFDGTIMELQTKSVDLGMAGYSPKPERENAMDFSDIFYTGGQSFVTTKANIDKFTTLEDINNPDYAVGAQIGSIQMDLANTYCDPASVVALPKVTDIISDLVAGNLDGAFIETVVAESYAQTYTEMAVVLPVPYEQEGSVVGVSKGNEPLLAAVNLAIQAALADGSMDRFVTEANELATGSTARLVDGEIVLD